jgi:3'-phosphoadenosine 5'-phosphosulfate sulfotransferase (PAPS reductase)/FAD synthetase
MEKQMKRLAISFSGGRTSAVMTKLLLERYRGTDTEVSVTFANTGCEHPATLEFVRKCDEVFGFGTVWMEGVTGTEGVGMRHKVVTFETASRNGEPFQDYISKFGVPCQSHPQCTSRLKEDVMYDYRRSIGWTRGTLMKRTGVPQKRMNMVLYILWSSGGGIRI